MSIRTLAVLALVSVAVPAEASWPCKCEDLADMRASLDNTRKTRTAYYSVLVDLMTNTPKAPADMPAAKLSFQKYMGWTSVREVGNIDAAGDPIINKAYRDSHCDAVVDGTVNHEHAHHTYMRWHVFAIAGASERHLARILVESEIDARNGQARFLSNEIKKLNKSCGGRDYSSDAYAPGGRIQAHVE